MKQIVTALLLIVCIGTIGAADLESYEFIDLLLSLPGPVAPLYYQDAVLFTASSSFRRVGISFAHEGFSTVHWMQKLMLPRDPADIAADGKNAATTRDSGILFHVEVIPDGLQSMDYRMVIDGLWTVDPLNPDSVTGSGGILLSRVPVPSRPRRYETYYDAATGQVNFGFPAPTGELITIGGSFNNWDPFMYEMRETSPGFYSIAIALPPGTYQYAFFFRGERYLDPYNHERVYTRDGKTASQTRVR